MSSPAQLREARRARILERGADRLALLKGEISSLPKKAAPADDLPAATTGTDSAPGAISDPAEPAVVASDEQPSQHHTPAAVVEPVVESLASSVHVVTANSPSSYTDLVAESSPNAAPHAAVLSKPEDGAAEISSSLRRRRGGAPLGVSKTVNGSDEGGESRPSTPGDAAPLARSAEVVAPVPSSSAATDVAARTASRRATLKRTVSCVRSCSGVSIALLPLLLGVALSAVWMQCVPPANSPALGGLHPVHPSGNGLKRNLARMKLGVSPVIQSGVDDDEVDSGVEATSVSAAAAAAVTSDQDDGNWAAVEQQLLYYACEPPKTWVSIPYAVIVLVAIRGLVQWTEAALLRWLSPTTTARPSDSGRAGPHPTTPMGLLMHWLPTLIRWGGGLRHAHTDMAFLLFGFVLGSAVLTVTTR